MARLTTVSSYTLPPTVLGEDILRDSFSAGADLDGVVVIDIAGGLEASFLSFNIEGLTTVSLTSRVSVPLFSAQIWAGFFSPNPSA